MVIKKKKCRHCGGEFIPFMTTQVVCSPVCAADYAVKKRKEKEQKDWDKQKAEMKMNLETHSELQKRLQVEINHIARLIDKGHPCMMCGKPMRKKINGCHYHSAGSNNSIRFNLFNIWAGCEDCNKWNSGNINGFDNQLVEIYGKKFWESIKFDLVREWPEVKMTKDELREKIKLARKIIRELKKVDLVYTNKIRIRMREEINETLGIYVKEERPESQSKDLPEQQEQQHQSKLF